MQVFTQHTAIALINRELAKRATTYPRLLERRRKAALKSAIADGAPADEAEFFADGVIWPDAQIMENQNAGLGDALKIIEGKYVFAPESRGAAFAELKRELAMRKKLYPRFIYLKRITSEVAERELADWETLVEFFTENFIARTIG